MRFRTSAFIAFTAVALAVPVTMPAQSKNGKASVRRIFVTALDRFDTPVTDLTAADFDVTESGLKRDVAGATLVATTPMRIALMIDTGDPMTPALNHLRAGLSAFADAIGADHELMMVTLGRQVRVRLQPTADRKKFKDSAAGLFMDGGATVLSDGLMEIDDRFMRKAENRWPVFVIVTADGAEGSSGANEKKLNNWVQALPLRDIAVHAVVIKYRGGGQPEIVASAAAENASGHYDFVNTSNSLPDKLKAIGEQIARDFQSAKEKYEVTFASPMPVGTPIVLAVLRPGVKFEVTTRRLR
jgi:hypothetical protein